MANIFTQGPPSIPAPASSNIDALDVVNNVGYVSTSAGWQPVTTSVAKAVVSAQTANNANVLTYAVPNTALYEVNFYEVSANTPTGATLPAISVTFTEALLGTSTTATSATVGSVSAANVVNTGVLNVYAKAGTNIVVSTTSYAAGSGTALSYDAVIRLQALG